MSEPEGNSMAELGLAILQQLSQAAAPQSSIRLAKQLGVRQSTLLRCLAYMGNDSIGSQPGPGWVSSTEDQGRYMLSITEAGRLAAQRGFHE